MTKRVLVVGSANQDLVVSTPRIPAVGETIIGTALTFVSGGKGLNQACACASAGADTVFLGAVGDDENGRRLLDTLSAAGVNVSKTARVSQPTGTAHILVSPDGGNQIVVVPGANGEVSPQYSLEQAMTFPLPAAVVLQGEIPLDTNLAVAKWAEEVGARVVFNLAPAMTVPHELLALSNPLVVNEFEAGLVLGEAAPSNEQEAIASACALAQNAKSVIVTLGAAGSVVAWDEGEEVAVIPPSPVDLVADTTGAGDAFVGVLAAELAGGQELLGAARAASAAAALTVTEAGASASYFKIRERYVSGH